MASTYSDLKIELIGTGDQTGTWGTTTNNNFSVALSEAITGSADVPFSSSDVTVTLTDTNAAQIARNLRLNLTGTSGGARQLILGSGCQIQKLYLINNGLADAVTVKNTSGTGIAVPAGKSMFVYNNGTNVVDATTHLSSLTLGAALPIASGGTGSTSSTYVNLASNVTGTLPIANGGTNTAGVPTNGQLLIGNGTGYTLATLTAGSGITVTDGSGSITIASAVAFDYPGAGIANSTGTSWGTSYTVSGTGTVVALATAASLSAPQFTAYQETCTTVGTVSGATYNIDLSLSNIFDITLGNNVTFTFTNPPASGTSKSATIILRQDGTGNRLATFTNANFTDGVAPILSTGANQIDVLTFFTLNGGSFWFGTFAMANVS
jgi:hypothetical protein